MSDENKSFDGIHFDRRVNQHEGNAALSYTPFETVMDDADAARLDTMRALAELFDKVLFWCWNCKGKSGQYKLRRFRAAQNHFVAMSALIKPGIFDGMSYEQIGAKIGVSKQHISDMADSFQKEFGVHFRRSHTKQNQHAVAAKKSWRKPGRVKTWKRVK